MERVAVWLGNSQVHAINHFKPGQENGPPILFRKLRKKGVDLVTLSQPNANLQEHYLLFEHLRSRLSFDCLILSVVFDDTRNDGIRHLFLPIFDDERTVASLKLTESGRDLLQRRHESADADDNLAGLSETLQRRSERFLSNWLESNSRIWRLRPQARGQQWASMAS